MKGKTHKTIDKEIDFPPWPRTACGREKIEGGSYWWSMHWHYVDCKKCLKRKPHSEAEG